MYCIMTRVGNGSGSGRVKQIPARERTRDSRLYPTRIVPAGTKSYPYPYPTGIGSGIGYPSGMTQTAVYIAVYTTIMHVPCIYFQKKFCIYTIEIYGCSSAHNSHKRLIMYPIVNQNDQTIKFMAAHQPTITQ
jgi:hypothetical protein